MAKDRRDKILDVAIALAEEGGFDNVRQRDVAAKAGVALGTLYKSFRSKEDILSAALERDTEGLERKLEKKPVTGDDVQERLGAFFQQVTRRLLRKPNFARAVLRAMASGDPEAASNVIAYHGRMTGMIIAAMRGDDANTAPPADRETTLALLLQQIWFSALVGWSAGMHGQARVVDQVKTGIELLVRGQQAVEQD